MIVLYIYLSIINLAGFIMMGEDKNKARRGKARISERSLFIAAWIGGSAGIYLGIFAFRHKTKHLKFTVGIPLVMAAQVAAMLFLTGIIRFF